MKRIWLQILLKFHTNVVDFLLHLGISQASLALRSVCTKNPHFKSIPSSPMVICLCLQRSLSSHELPCTTLRIVYSLDCSQCLPVLWYWHLSLKVSDDAFIWLNGVKIRVFVKYVGICLHKSEKNLVPLHSDYVALNPICRIQKSSFMTSGEAAYAVPSMAEFHMTKQYEAGIGWEKQCKPNAESPSLLERQAEVSPTMSKIVQTY